MTIGEELRQIRKSLQLSQTQMAGGVLSTSYYSKIERGLNDIQVQDLIDLLEQHGIKASDFLANIEKNNQETNFTYQIFKWKRQLQNAYYHQQINQLEKIKTEIEKYKDQNQSILNLYALAVFAIALLRKQTDQISEKIKQQVRQVIFNSEEWNETNLQIFAMTMIIYEPEDMDLLVNSIFKAYRNVSDLSDYLQELLSAIAINYLANVYVQKRKANLAAIYDFISKLPEVPRNAFVKIVANYYRACFKGEQNEAKQIINFLKANGMANLIKNFIVKE